MRGRKVRTLKARRLFLEELARCGNVERSCAVAGISKSSVYEWRADPADASFREEWNASIQTVMDAIEAKLIEQARTDDSPAGVTLRIFLLKHQRAAVYNPGMLIRHEAMRLELERRRQEMNAPPLLEGRATMVNGVRTDFIHIISMPFNWRDASPHAPKFDPYGDHDDAAREIVPVEQDGSGLTMGLPESCMCIHHSEPFEYLPVSLRCQPGGPIDPRAAIDLWARILAHNTWLARAYPALVPKEPRGYAQASEDPLDDGPHPEDDDPPGQLEDPDWSGGFGRP